MRSADNVVLIRDNLGEITLMLTEGETECQQVGLEINNNKRNSMTNMIRSEKF